ncbi:MAG TPA: hypothetical protein VLL54_16445 [Pyrinomonadaceae bacterium]|nr:hypothetical protein [Pyrinomonadaceae bacterium]
MDWLKTTLDRLSGVLTSLIPGSVIFLLFALHKPELVGRVWESQLLTYNTKLILSVFFSLLIGHTVNFGLSTLMGAIGGAIGGYIRARPVRPDPEVKPWQNKNWRTLLATHLGKAAPDNVNPIPYELFEMQVKALQNHPAQERLELFGKLLKEKAAADSNDYEWRGWWDYFHRASFLKRGPQASLYDDISSGFCSASLVVLIALPFTPEFRVWWLVVTSVAWILFLVLRTIADFKAVLDPWSSMFDQLERLEERVGELEGE